VNLPAPPAAQPQTATLVDPNGSGTSPLAFDVTSLIPAGGKAELLTPALAGTASLAVVGQGTWTLAPSGAGTFTPVLGFAGAATPVQYRITDAYGQISIATVDATVVAPDALTAPVVTSTGVGDAAQPMQLLLPADGAVTLHGADGDTNTLTVSGEGSYTLSPGTGIVTFTPLVPFTGQATAVTYRVQDSYGTWSNLASIFVTVEAPAAPAPQDVTTTGVGTALQHITLPVAPDGGSRSVLGVLPRTINGQGTYSLDVVSGEVSFAPVLGFVGDATPATFRLTDAYGHSGDAIWTPTVTIPAGPPAADQTATGSGTDSQSVTAPVPTGGSVTLLDQDGSPVSTLTIPGQGTYTLDPITGEITFEPVLGFAGNPTPVTFRVTDAYGQTHDAQFAPTVDRPAPLQPLVIDDGETTGTVPADVQVTVPPSGQAALIDINGAHVSELTVEGEGTWVLDLQTGQATFTPVLGFHGTATPVSYVVRDAYGTWSNLATLTVTVLAPAGPHAASAASSGVGTTPQHVNVTAAPAGGRVRLLDVDGHEVTDLTVEGVGRYLLDPAAHTVTVTPVLGFAGVASPVQYQITDAYGQSSQAPLVATVNLPAAPTSVVTPISNPPAGNGGGHPTTVAVDVPSGGTITLLNANGGPVTDITFAGKGTYHLDTATGVITFTPVSGFSGDAPEIQFSVTDAYHQTVTGHYSAHVSPTATKVPKVGLQLPSRVVVGTNARVSPVCQISVARMTDCTVTLTAKVGNKTVEVGTGRLVRRPTAAGKPETASVTLNRTGRDLLARPGGVVVTANSAVKADGVSAILRASTRSRLVPASVAAGQVFFTTDSSKLDKRDLGLLGSVRKNLSWVRVITCIGNTDSTGRSKYNLDLGMARAKATCAQLTKGLHVRVVVKTSGELHPQASNTTARGRAYNRRADIVLSY
jgi:CshA-type fibril repeat protein